MAKQPRTIPVAVVVTTGFEVAGALMLTGAAFLAFSVAGALAVAGGFLIALSFSLTRRGAA